MVPVGSPMLLKNQVGGCKGKMWGYESKRWFFRGKNWVKNLLATIPSILTLCFFKKYQCAGLFKL